MFDLPTLFRSTRVISPVALAGAIALSAGAAGAASFEDSGRYIFVPNRASADVAVIDSRTDSLVTRIQVGNVPHQVVIADRVGKMVASNTDDNTVSIVDLAAPERAKTLMLDVEPEHMELGPDGITLAVGNIGAGTVSLLSLHTDREIARIDGLFEPHNLTFSPDGSLLYVANLGADHISVIDVAEAALISEIPVVGSTPVAAAGEGAEEEYQGIINVTRTPDGRFGFAAHGEGNSLAVVDLRSFGKVKNIDLGELPWRAFSTADGRYMLVPNNGDETVSVISTSRLEVVATLPGAEDMTGVNTGWFETVAAVVSRGEDKLVLIDLIEMAPAGEIALPGTPETGVTTPDGRKLYVALSGSDQVAVVDLKTRTLVKTIDDVGEEPWGVTMAGALNYCH